MPASLVEGNSLLAIDIGAVNTRAAYFDVVEGRYRHVGSGLAQGTAAAPWRDVSQGIRMAILDLQTLLGRPILDADGRLIIPSQPDGGGVDTFAATLSAGPAIKTVVVGLLSEVSLDSAQRLARSTYSRVVESMGMNDHRAADQQVDTIARLSPDLILVAGGTENGASRSLQKMIETIGLACYLLPQDKRPSILYAGNHALAEDAATSLQRLASGMLVSPNVRPSLETEDLAPAEKDLALLYSQIRKRQLNGVEDLAASTGNAPLPTSYAQGRIVRFISNVSDKGILAVDLGASAATVLAGYRGRLSTGVFSQFGLGEALGGLLRHASITDITQWLAIDLPEEVVRDYLYLKALHPATIPVSAEDLAVEQAVARVALQQALRAARPDFPPVPAIRGGLLPSFDPIIAAGSVFTAAPTAGQALLILLDALQPAGFVNILVDQGNLMPALGVAADFNPLLPVHVIEAGAFMPLASVVAPFSTAGYGNVVLKVRLIGADGNTTDLEVKQGGLEVLPLPVGATGVLELRPVGRTDAGLGAGRSYRVEAVKGSALGVVIDARGRPLRLDTDVVRRRELLKKWLWTLGG
jgi:MutL-like protein